MTIFIWISIQKETHLRSPPTHSNLQASFFVRCQSIHIGMSRTFHFFCIILILGRERCLCSALNICVTWLTLINGLPTGGPFSLMR
nr:MAG TPA: hypothetical protein [Caudoviricetes sp.]